MIKDMISMGKICKTTIIHDIDNYNDQETRCRKYHKNHLLKESR